MLLLQINNDESQTTALVVVIEPENLARMRQGDPITLHPQSQSGWLEPIRYPDGFGVIVAVEEDPGRCYELQNDPAALLALEREK